jgi:hypothetical protein
MTLPLPLPTGARARALVFDSFDVPLPVRGPLPTFVTEVLPRSPNNPRQPKPVITKAEKAAKRRASKGCAWMLKTQMGLAPFLAAAD